MKPRVKPPEILRKSHAHKSDKDYRRENVTCYFIDEKCPECKGKMAAGGTGSNYSEWCVGKCIEDRQ